MKILSIALIVLLAESPVAFGSRKGTKGDDESSCGRTLKAKLSDPLGKSGVSGTISFTCPSDFKSELTEITYNISGLSAGKHALHVHQEPVGDDCTSTLGHWNPENNNHGSNLDAQRHIGDLGNILADGDGNAKGTLLARAPLTGDLGINGRSVVVHAGEDDLGTGGDDGSRAVGNAGARPACGTIYKE
jgi:Cu-Zn family superoxide dismutase